MVVRWSPRKLVLDVVNRKGDATAQSQSVDSVQGIRTNIELNPLCTMQLTDTACRFGRRCEYEASQVSSSGPTPSQSPGSETFLASEPFAPTDLKNALIHKLEAFTPESAVSAYHHAIEPWFPIACKLQDRVRPTWDETSLDIALLCLSILLLTTRPSSTANSDGNTSELETIYLQTKSALALAEGLGFNSFPIVQSRILITLFEVSHGFYPAAYISIGATLRAVDALEVHPRGDALQPHCADLAVSHEETILIWCGILVLDR